MHDQLSEFFCEESVVALKGCIYIIVISPTCNIYYKSKEKKPLT